MRRPAVGTLVSLAAVLCVQASVRAAAPEVLSFQGRLADDAGNLVADGPHNVTFAIYDVEAAGAPLWSDTLVVTTTDGLFAVLLGDTSTGGAALGLAFDAQYWLGIEVESDGEMTPRFKFAAAPYAIRAGTAAAADTAVDADTVDGSHAAAFADAATLASAGTVNTPGNPVDWTQLKSVPADFADGTDADTIYVDGAGIFISGPTISADFGAGAAQVAAGDHTHATYVAKAGDTMLGALTLPGDPAGLLDAATKQYVDAAAVDADTVDGSHAAAFAGASHTHATYVAKAGDTMAGALTLPGDPAGLLDAATKQYVDAAAVDADTVDGSHAAAFAGASHTHAGTDVTSAVAQATDADLLDGLDSTAFLQAEADTLQTVCNRGNSVTGSAGPVLWAENTSTMNGNIAIRGRASAATGRTYGVWGQSDGDDGHGVYGYASAATGFTYGLFGRATALPAARSWEMPRRRPAPRTASAGRAPALSA